MTTFRTLNVTVAAIAVTAAMLGASIGRAHASPLLACVMTGTKGDKVVYSFVKFADNSVHEFMVIRNSVTVADHRDGTAMPGWAAGWNNQKFWLVPDANPEYQLVVTRLGPMNAEGWRVSDAAMWKDGRTFVSRGQCGTKGAKWNADASSPAAPAPAPIQAAPTVAATIPQAAPAAPAPAQAQPLPAGIPDPSVMD